MPLRTLTAADLAMVRAWRNAPEIRSRMFNKHEISEAEHLAWFERLQTDVKSCWMIHEDEAGHADGVVYFTQIDAGSRSAFWGFYTAPGAAKGTGTLMGVDAMDHAFEAQGLHKVSSEVLAGNEASLHFQKKLGFQQEGVLREAHFDGERHVDVLRLGLLRHEWHKQRPALARSKTGTSASTQGKSYIIATCKPWHEEGYQALTRTMDASWTLVRSREELASALASTQPRYIFFLHWSWVVPHEVWTQHECVCFHMTDVPYGRGGSPLQNLILAGHRETKLTALRMTDEVDAGPVYKKVPLSLNGKAQDIYVRAGDLSFEVIKWMVEQEPTPTPQQGHVVHFTRRKPEQSLLPAQGSLESTYDFIRMLDAEGYPHAFVEHGDFVIEFIDAQRVGTELVAQAVFTPISHTQRV